MNKLVKVTIFICILLIGVSCQKETSTSNNSTINNKESKTKVYYTCSMHPQIKEDKPGKCPICHMNLTKIEIDDEDDVPVVSTPPEKDLWQCEKFPDVTSESEDVCPMDGTQMVKKEKENKAALVIAKVKLRKAQLKHFNPDYFPVTSMKMTKKIRLLGSVLQSEEKESNIPARIGGRVEKVYVKSTGSFVKVGDPVIDLYSPKLITAGEEYLLARQSYSKSKTKEFKDMLNQSIERLKLWGIKKFQFENWYEKGKIPRQITIYSNATGIVRTRNATVGKYFKEGQNFFELSDLADVWVEMDVYEHDSSLIKIGQKVELEFTAIPGEALVGEIDFVNPVLDKKSRTLKVRATIENTSGKLKPGMIANAVLNIDIDGMPLVVPRTAIIDTGKRKVVWVKISGKSFQAKTIHAGYESEGYVEIKHGLMEGEEVVIEGNFLLDAQAQLFGGYEDMKDSKASGHNH
ncbi:MAG: multidrug efflux pump subunit AcrA (membrane-fusion protein) [Bacteriovoracaceae bacterium]|jgi:multidrug efflux pump subunit AcrA (membrane-fusion protein)